MEWPALHASGDMIYIIQILMCISENTSVEIQPPTSLQIVTPEVSDRPVVSNCGTPTERISEFWDYHVNPIVKVLPTVLSDTSDFLRRLDKLGHIPEVAIFGIKDVVGLYPHIPHKVSEY